MLTDESAIGIWLWAVLVVSIAAQVVAIDVWLHRHGHEYLTTEYREGLRNVVAGPVLVFLSFGLVAALAWHFYNTRGA